MNTLDCSVYVADVQGDIRPRFLRGDCDGDGGLDISDAILLLNHLFRGSQQPEVPEACNSDDVDPVNVTDAVYLLEFLFARGEPPPSPFPGPGIDPSP